MYSCCNLTAGWEGLQKAARVRERGERARGREREGERNRVWAVEVEI